MTEHRAVPRRATAAIAGVVAAAAALGVGEFTSGALGASPSPVLGVGGRFVDQFAASLKEMAVAIFGTNDKPALVVGTVVVTLALGAATGLATRRWALAPFLVFIGFGAFGAWAQSSDPQVSTEQAAIVATASVAGGLAAFRLLWRLGPGQTPDQSGRPDDQLSGPPPSAAVAEDPRVKPLALANRRRFLVATGAAGAVSIGLAAAGRALLQGDLSGAAKAIRFPRPVRRLAAPDDTAFRPKGATPYVVRNADFYRIDTALSIPRVDADTWRLRIGGMVDQPFSIGYEELLSLPSVEEPVTLQCVSNEIGGDLVGNAVWQGVPLTELIERAGVRGNAEQVFSTSVDGWTCGFPLDALDDDRTALVAYAMNGEPLPPGHGFPARLVVSGLYGYVSATKWLQSIDLTTWSGRDGYWIPRGWSKEGPIKLASRIDVPRPGSEIPAGATAVAGVAWLPGVGVSAVEVSVDDGPWRECELGDVASEHTWVQWKTRWDATPGDHRIRVRAVDRNGVAQIEAIADPAPNGATGLHEVAVTVRP